MRARWPTVMRHDRYDCLAVRVLRAPPRSRPLTEISRFLMKAAENCPLARGRLVSASGQLDSNGHFGAFVSGLKIPFPGNRDRAKQRLVRMRRYRWERPRIWCCSRPFGGQVGEASNPHAMRQPPFDSRLDEVRCKEGKRDRHIHFSDAALLPLGDGLRSCCCISDQFLEPTAAAGDRCD